MGEAGSDSELKSAALGLGANDIWPNDMENPCEEKEAMGSSSGTGVGVTWRPGLSASVPRMKSEFLGLMQHSSTLILFVVTMPWRVRKARRLSGTGSLLVK